MRFHLLGLVHLPQSTRYPQCAFTAKNLKLAKMLTSLGHEVFFYGSEGSDVEEYCNSDKLHFIETHSLSDIRKDFGSGDNRFELGYDTSLMFRNDFNSKAKPSTLKFNRVVSEYINKHKQESDFLLLSQGVYQKPIADKVGLYLTCEPGIGYRGSFARFRAFESSYIQNFTYGGDNPRASVNGNYYDRIIPNYFDVNEFTFKENHQDYFLYLGRMIIRKGVWTAIKTTAELGVKLVLAGQKDDEININHLPSHCEYVGVVDSAKRDELMGGAIATFTPTVYLEPFCGVHIESQLTGTPVLTTNFGVFPETVKNGVNGYRCNTLDDFIWAAKKSYQLDRAKVRKEGERYSMNRVKWEYEKWFDDLFQLYLSSKDDKVKGWHYIRQAQPRWRDYEN